MGQTCGYVLGRLLFNEGVVQFGTCEICEDYFEHSEDLGLTITLWMDEERNDKIFDYSDFEQLHRPYSDWGDQEFNREADDYEDEDEA